MPTIIYQGRRVAFTDAAARLIATTNAAPARTRPLVTQDAAAARAPRAFFDRHSREAGCAQLRAENERNRAFWAAQRG
ncbi:MAG: hypothetical protein ACRYHQ_07620 [Janthinobacterium lividum]